MSILVTGAFLERQKYCCLDSNPKPSLVQDKFRSRDDVMRVYQAATAPAFATLLRVYDFKYQTRLYLPELRFGVQMRHFLLEWHVTTSLAGEGVSRCVSGRMQTSTACYSLRNVATSLEWSEFHWTHSRNFETGSGGSSPGKIKDTPHNCKRVGKAEAGY